MGKRREYKYDLKLLSLRTFMRRVDRSFFTHTHTHTHTQARAHTHRHCFLGNDFRL